MTILVTGIAGGLARRVAMRLQGEGRAVVGVDYREAAPLPGITTYRASYVKTAIEDVFRRHAVEAVLHLGRVGNLSERIDMRFDLNVVGSQRIMALCLAHGVKALVVLSTFHIYGAHPRNHTPISEDDPLRAGHEFPEIADAIQLDNMASTWIWRHPETRVVVLRPTNVIGPTIQNTMSKILRRPRVPYLLGFDPMTQFVHEDDLTAAVAAALDGHARGVFNIAGSAALPWTRAIELAGARPLPVPGSMLRFAARVFGGLPDYLVNFVKYPCVLTDQAFRDAFGWAPEARVREALASIVAEAKRGATA
ncbi:MAG: NAD-dependent epimerase/dehydratase family protein [Polyangiaceae bacterium]|nr:NAD-dependent epimerase/dehydratase family protein [Polyangiaceae bacterium]